MSQIPSTEKITKMSGSVALTNSSDMDDIITEYLRSSQRNNLFNCGSIQGEDIYDAEGAGRWVCDCYRLWETLQDAIIEQESEDSITRRSKRKKKRRALTKKSSKTDVEQVERIIIEQGEWGAVLDELRRRKMDKAALCIGNQIPQCNYCKNVSVNRQCMELKTFSMSELNSFMELSDLQKRRSINFMNNKSAQTSFQSVEKDHPVIHPASSYTRVTSTIFDDYFSDEKINEQSFTQS